MTAANPEFLAFSPLNRRAALAALAGGAASAAAGPAARAARTQGGANSRVETVTTPDGWTLPVQVTLPGGANEDTPVILLVHGADESRKNWESLANFLAGRGYAAVAPDLRHHGEARNPGVRTSDRLNANDYRAMVGLDLEAVKALLLDLHGRKQINVRKLGVVASEEGAPLAVQFAFNDWRKQPLPDAPVFADRTPTGQDVRAIVLMSPEDAVAGVNASAAARPLSDDAADIGFLIVTGDADGQDGGASDKLFNRFGGRRDDRKDRVQRPPLPGIPLRGVDLLRDPVGGNIKGGIANFLDRWVRDRPDPWRSREGRL